MGLLRAFSSDHSRRRTSYIVSLATVIAALATTGFGSCSSSKTLAQLCDQDFKEFVTKFSDARLALAPWVPKETDPRVKRADRMIASIDPARPASEPIALADEHVALAAIDRRSWNDWAIQRIHEVQGYIDVISDRGRFASSRKELSQILNELVVFHGHSEIGNARGMELMLRRVEDRSQLARRLACDSK